MAYRGLWDPYAVLDVNPKDPNCTCVGFGTWKQKRCGYPLYKIEQFDPSQRITAIRCLELMSQRHPSEVDLAALEVLAKNILCREWHQYQARDKSNEWKARIDLYLHEHDQKPAVGRQLPNGTPKNSDSTSEREIKATRLALENLKAELEESETRCSGLIDKNSKLDREREEYQAASTRRIASLSQQLKNVKTDLEESEARCSDVIDKSSELEQERTEAQTANSRTIASLSQQLKNVKTDLEESETRCSELTDKNSKLDREQEEAQTANSRTIASLNQQLTDARTWARALEQQKTDDADRLTKRLTDTKTAEIARVKKQMADRDARFEKDAAASEEEISGLRARVRELEGSNRRDVEGRDQEIKKQVLNLQERDREVEMLTGRLEGVGRELEGREEVLSALRLRNVKRGLCVVVSWRPPRVVVRRMEKVVGRENAGCVSNVA